MQCFKVIWYKTIAFEKEKFPSWYQLGNDFYTFWVEFVVFNLNQSCAITNNQIQSNLHWTAKKIDLIELIYALHESKVFDNGNADIKEITHVFEKAFQIDLGDNITRSFIDIKNRKTDQTRFLNQLQATLETKIENDLN